MKKRISQNWITLAAVALATAVSVLSRSGGQCRLALPGIGSAAVEDSQGKRIETTREADDLLSFASKVGETYTLVFK